MQLFISFKLMDVYGEDPLLTLETASDFFKAEYKNIEQLYIHDGKGNAYQENRKCDCGSHFFKDVPYAISPYAKFVACMKCGKQYPVQ